MAITELSVLWMICLFSVMTITKSEQQIVVGHEQLYCLGMEKRHRLKRIHSRNEFVPVLVPFDHYTKSCDTDDSKGVLLHWHRDIQTQLITNTNQPNWKICTEFGKEGSKDGDLYFLRIININLEKKNPNEQIVTHRNCRNWEAHQVMIDGVTMDNFIFIYQVQRLKTDVRFIGGNFIQVRKDEELSDIMLLPTEFTTDWIPGPRPGIVMMPMRRCNNNKGLNWCVTKKDLDEIAEKHKIFKKRALKLAAFKSAMIGVGIVGAAGFFPAGISIVIGVGAGAAAMGGGVIMNNADLGQEMLNKRKEQGLSLNDKQEDVREYLQDEIAQQRLKQWRD